MRDRHRIPSCLTEKQVCRYFRSKNHMLVQHLGHIGIVQRRLEIVSLLKKNVRRDLRVRIQPRPASSVMPPLLIQKLAAVRFPPILFWPSSSWPIVPDCPPEAVNPKEQQPEDLGAANAEVPKARERVTSVLSIAKVFPNKKRY